MLTEVVVYILHHQSANFARPKGSNMIYHKFSYDAASYAFNGKNVNVILK